LTDCAGIAERGQCRMREQLSAFLGVFRYEFKMQIRRKSLWIAFAGFTLLLLSNAFTVLHSPERSITTLPLVQLVAAVTLELNWLPAIGIGVFLADRFPRDRSSKVDELFETTPGALHTRLAGKYFGSVLASIVPAFLIYCIIIGILAFYKQTLLIFPIAFVSYAVIVVPGILFIAAFTLFCTSVLWIPLYQFLFVGYWFWGNMLSPNAGLPTLTGTILTPIGGFICAGIFGVAPMPWLRGATPFEGLASLFVLLIVPLLVMVLFYYCLKWEQSRK